MAITLKMLNKTKNLNDIKSIKTYLAIPEDTSLPIRATKRELEKRLGEGVTYTVLMSLACTALAKELDRHPTMSEKDLFNYLK